MAPGGIVGKNHRVPRSAPRPMKATAGELPVGGDWWFEVKWDGMRLVLVVEGDDVRAWSANGNDVTVSFPELGALGGALGVASAVLDGEIVVLDADGRPSFSALQHRMHVTNPRVAAERAAERPGVFMAFDLLELDGNDVTGLPLTDRRRLLDALLDRPGPHWQVPAVHDDGQALLDAVDARGMEGVIAKQPDSDYHPGTRTTRWRKVKIRRRQEFVVGGWAPGQGSRRGRIGGLLLGVHPVRPDGSVASSLSFVGRVGSGLNEAELSWLADRFAAIGRADCPFDPAPPTPMALDARWVEPTLVVEVAYAEWTPDGVLRHPTYIGRRVDVDAETVTSDP